MLIRAGLNLTKFGATKLVLMTLIIMIIVRKTKVIMTIARKT